MSDDRDAKRRRKEDEKEERRTLRDTKWKEIRCLQKYQKLPVIFLIGTTTHGKSTLIKLLYSPDDNPGKEPAIADSARGCTKVPEWYICKASDGKQYVLVDNPGIGDADVPEMDTITFTSTLFDDGLACGALFVNEVSQNLGIVNKMMGTVFKSCVKGGFDNILLVCTKCDRNDKGTNDSRMKGLAESFTEEFGHKAACVLGTSTEDPESIDALRKRIEEMLPARVDFKLTDMKDLTAQIAAKMRFEDNTVKNDELKAKLETQMTKLAELRKDLKATRRALRKEMNNKHICSTLFGWIPGADVLADAIDDAMASSGSSSE